MPITRPLLVAALTCALALSQSIPAADLQKGRSSVALRALADRYYEAQVRFDPVYSATLAGDNRFDDRLSITIAPAERKKRFMLYHQIQRQLDAIPTLLANFGTGQAEQPLKTVAQYEAYLKRIERLPAWTDQAIANMR